MFAHQACVKAPLQTPIQVQQEGLNYPSSFHRSSRLSLPGHPTFSFATSQGKYSPIQAAAPERNSHTAHLGTAKENAGAPLPPEAMTQGAPPLQLLQGLSVPCPCPGCLKRSLITRAAAASGGAGKEASFGTGVTGEEASLGKAVAEKVVNERKTRADWINKLYVSLVAKFQDFYNSKAGMYKDELFQALLEQKSNAMKKTGQGTFNIMEIGIGSGPNLVRYAAPDIHVIGTDPNGEARSFAEASAMEACLKPGQFEFLQAAAEGLPLEDNSQDAVLSTLVLCSVEDVLFTVSEVLRVLKPGGKFYFMEHVGAPEGTTVRWWQDLLDPVQQRLADNCHLTRTHVPALRDAGFGSVHARSINVEGMLIFSPHQIGTAAKLW